MTKAIDFLLASPLLKGAACHLLRAGRVDDKANGIWKKPPTKLRAAGYAVTSHAIPGEPERSSPTP